MVRRTANESHPDQDGQDDKNDNPHGTVQVGPELKEDADGRNLGRNTEQIPVDQVPTDGKLECWVDQESGMADKTARDLGGKVPGQCLLDDAGDCTVDV